MTQGANVGSVLVFDDGGTVATNNATRSTLDLAPAAEELGQLVLSTEDGDLERRTPCAEWTVAELLIHLRGFAAASTAAASRRPFTGDEPVMTDPLEAGWRQQLPDRLNELAVAWADPAAWSGTTEAAGIVTPADVAGNAALQELLLHGWDLARATGRPFATDPASVTACWDFVSSLSEEERSQPFAAAIPTSSDSTDLDCLLAMSGRSPEWAPPKEKF